MSEVIELDENLTMDLSVPSCLTSTPLSLVSFVGLDRPHLAWIWNEFVHRNRGMDRVPIRIVKGDSLEWPRGVAEKLLEIVYFHD